MSNKSRATRKRGVRRCFSQERTRIDLDFEILHLKPLERHQKFLYFLLYKIRRSETVFHRRCDKLLRRSEQNLNYEVEEKACTSLQFMYATDMYKGQRDHQCGLILGPIMKPFILRVAVREAESAPPDGEAGPCAWQRGCGKENKRKKDVGAAMKISDIRKYLGKYKVKYQDVSKKL
ncbi:hypothetical protein MG293_017074 [Ovis ammon polii]|uniref:Uncharacterized protein n=1 Tax=Ovis ammon polii TaxID=230172 RepID=A0AAD4TU25_OVIAM|nr:hypothetical protein MG293_017074 [Ovis ammon polii]